jgi:mono/diheme cytochrome c family protein
MSAKPFHAYMLTAVAFCLVASFAIGSEPVPQFESDVLPILKSKCSTCHGADEPEGGFQVASLAAIMAGGESGTVVTAGEPAASRIFELIEAGEMPPKDEGTLSSTQIEVIRRWIADGQEISEFESHQQVTTDRIIPLMLLRCAACHGHRRREADLDLRTPAGMLKGGKSGAVIVPGKPAESLLIQRVHAEEMPPRRQLVSVSVKPMETDELALLERWIAAGMPDSPTEAPPAQPHVAEAARQFWSFQPPQAMLPPVKSESNRSFTEIDSFVAARHREHGLTPAAEADRITLIRRLSLDLLGLPPTPDEIDQFVADSHPLAYQRLVERLLASPQYGARWARHWLDAAGYADSEGSQNEDRVRPNMWRYRDYVVRAFNDDKPYDRFLHEQIAGDELADYENAELITDQLYDNLVATGFLRTAPDRTFANITNFVPDRLEVIADEIQILGSAVLGLTIHCARCHSHKFDPISQRDYYQLAALLKDALDEHDWLGPQARTLTKVATAERQQWERHQQAFDVRTAELKQQIDAAPSDDAKKPLEEQLKQHESSRRPEPRIRALWARGEPSPTYLLKRGNYLTPGSEVTPNVPAVLTDASATFVITPPRPGATTTGRRLALAKWLTESTHPLTARVMVNRIWQHHFGNGIVSTPGNFGLAGDAPTHPQLLDWLAVEFMRQGWSIKSLHRTIVTSQTYRRSSQATAEQLAADPDNRWLTRMPLRRMEAEVLRDSLLFVAGQLDETPFGPPDDVDVQPDGLVTAQKTARGWRRSVYVLHRRTKLPTLLENFDSPQMSPNCIRRGESIVAPQALHLLNNPTVHQWARQFAERACRETKGDTSDRIRHIHRVALGCEPSDEELAIASDTLGRLEQQWLTTIPENAERADEAAMRALTNYCHAIMNSAAFSYVD